MRYTLAICIALTACAPQQQLAKPGASPQQFSQDEAECDYQSLIATVNVANPFEKTFIRNDIRSRCMKMRGYR